MKRKFFSAVMCVFALVLLMGAGNEPGSSAALAIEDESVSATVQNVNQASVAASETGTEQSEDAADEAREEDISPVDEFLLINGQPAPLETGKFIQNDTTFVAIEPMVKTLLPEAVITWDGASSTVIVETQDLNLTAHIGDLYLVANGRYLYMPETVQMRNDWVVVPLRTLAKALDAELTWDAATGVTSVTTGSGAIASGDSFYDQNTLFWLSRLITSESGNQPLKGMMAVGNVVMNRVNSPLFPNTVEGVLAQKNQFVNYCNGSLARWTPYEKCIIATKLVMDGGEVEETKGALFFDSAVSSWASRNKTYVATIGGHRFFK